MFDDLLAVIFPRNCVGCGNALQAAARTNEWEYLCLDCARDLRGVGEEACERCGVPVYGGLPGRRLCSICRENPPAWGIAKSFLRYTGPARGWVRSYKYHDARYVEREWAKLIKAPAYGYLREWLSNTILLPVPLHPIKRLTRGFNQSENIAKTIIAALRPPGAQLNTQILKRVRWTRQQARLGRERRLKNMKGAFAVDKSRVSPEFLHKRVILVDDLLTTGATLTACAVVLKRAGFKEIDVLTLCRG